MNDREKRFLLSAVGRDITIEEARSVLRKKAGSKPERKRTTPNIFTTLSGRAQPRQGFLPVEVLRAIYIKSDLVRACVDLLIEVVCSCQWTVKPIDAERSRRLKKENPEKYADQQKRIKWAKEFFTRPNGYENLDLFHRKLLRDLLIYDAAAYEIVIADYGDDRRFPVEIGVVAGDTIEIETDEHAIPTGYWQSYNVLHKVAYDFQELAYLQLNPVSWQPYGISPIESAYIQIASDLNANQHNADYFAKNGIPPGLLAVLGVSESEFRKIMSQLRVASSDNPHNIHGFRAQRNPDGSAQKVFEYMPLNQMSNRDMQFAELMRNCVTRVTMSYKVTPSQIGFTDETVGGIGSGVAETQENLYQNKGVAPLLRSLSQSHTFNILHSVCGWTDLEFTYEMSNTPQEVAEYGRSLQEVQAGVATINEHRLKFGGRDPVSWGDQPLQRPQPDPNDQMQQQLQMQAAQQPEQPDQQPDQQPQQLQKSIVIHL